MNNQDYITLIEKWQKDSCLDSRNMVVLNTTKLVYKIANSFKTNNSKDDLFSEGVLGVINACNTYSPSKGVMFMTYAKVCIKNQILDYLRLDHVIPRGSKSMHRSNLSYFPMPSNHSEIKKLADSTGVNYDTAKRYALSTQQGICETDGDIITSDVTYDTAVMLERCQSLLEKLDKIEKRDYDMLNAYYFQDKTLKEIGNDHTLSTQRIQQIIKNTVQQLGVNE